jgi:hypothetical protein
MFGLSRLTETIGFIGNRPIGKIASGYYSNSAKNDILQRLAAYEEYEENPPYFTLMEYEKTHGKPYPKTAPIWWRMEACIAMNDGIETVIWRPWSISTKKGLPFKAKHLQIVCAYNTLKPPPDNWSLKE